MDRASGRITPERYDVLAEGYEKEQPELKTKLESLEARLNDSRLCEKCIHEFINKAKQYVNMPKLTPELLRAFIKRIEVHEKEVKRSRTCGNHIVVYFTFQPDKAIKLDSEMSELGITEFAK
jgi:hypothetical protein